MQIYVMHIIIIHVHTYNVGSTLYHNACILSNSAAAR